MKFLRLMPVLKVVSTLVLVFLLVGCAAQLAFREGKNLLIENQFEEGIAKLKFASMNEPSNVEFRQTYLHEQERAVYVLFENAERARQSEQFDQARSLYQKLLRLAPENEVVKTALSRLAAEEKLINKFTEASKALEQQELKLARKLLIEILADESITVALKAKTKNLLSTITESVTVNQQEISLQNSYKKKINIEFRDAPIRQIFEVISRNSGLNFIFDKEVRTDQKASIFLKNSNIESAIQFTLLTNQLGQQVLDGNTILIYPNTAAKQKDYQEMMVKSFYLTNADVKKVENTLKTIVKTRDIVIDEKLNLLIMRDTPEAIRLAEKLIAVHDVAEPEVMLEVEILEVKRSRLLDLGIQWPNSLSLTPLSATQGATLNLESLRHNINGTTLGAGIGPATIKARKEDGDAKLLANPRIRAKNHEKAHILIGERVPNITTTATSTGFVSESINYIEVGLKLDVEPTVYLDNDVGIKVALEVSSITNQSKTQSGSIAYQIGTRNAVTALRLKNGETQILAGLINDEERQSANKIPLIGELPIVGRLFGSQVNDNQKTEIILSITPHLIRNIQVPENSIRTFSSGTESSLRVRGDQLDTSNYPASSGFSNLTETTKPEPLGSNLNEKAGSGNNASNPPSNAGAGIGVGAVNAITGAPQLQWQGPRQIKIGDTFSLQLIAQSDQAITSMPIKLGFNPQVLQVVSVSEGIFLKQGGAQTNFTQQIDPKGIVNINNVRTLGGATSPGGYLTLVLRAIAPVEATPIQMLSIEAFGLAGRPLAVPVIQPISIEIQP